MKFLLRALAALAVFLAPLAPAGAQFQDQATYAGTAGGTANAITLAVSNWSANRAGIPLRFLPSADSTSTVTIVVNSVGSPVALMKPSNAGLVALSGGELRAAQPATVIFDGTEWVLQNQLGKFVDSSDLSNAALNFGFATNLRLNPTVTANQLTVALKTAANADPTAATPILIPFRDTTIALGDPVVVPVTGALSITIGSGNSLGCVSGQMCRLWVVAANNAGTVAVCLFNAFDGTGSIAPINETALQTGASGTSGGASAQTYYCSTASLTNVAVRIIGFIEIQEATAGTWATGPTYSQLFGPGTKRPGDVVQTSWMNAAGTTSIPPSAAVATGITKAITPTSAANPIKVSASAWVVSSTSGPIASFVRRNGTTQVGQSQLTASGAATATEGGVSLIYVDVPASTSSTTYTYYGSSAAGTGTFEPGGIVLDELMG